MRNMSCTIGTFTILSLQTKKMEKRCYINCYATQIGSGEAEVQLQAVCF